MICAENAQYTTEARGKDKNAEALPDFPEQYAREEIRIEVLVMILCPRLLVLKDNEIGQDCKDARSGRNKQSCSTDQQGRQAECCRKSEA